MQPRRYSVSPALFCSIGSLEFSLLFGTAPLCRNTSSDDTECMERGLFRESLYGTYLTFIRSPTSVASTSLTYTSAEGRPFSSPSMSDVSLATVEHTAGLAALLTQSRCFGLLRILQICFAHGEACLPWQQRMSLAEASKTRFSWLRKPPDDVFCQHRALLLRMQTLEPRFPSLYLVYDQLLRKPVSVRHQNRGHRVSRV